MGLASDLGNAFDSAADSGKDLLAAGVQSTMDLGAAVTGLLHAGESDLHDLLSRGSGLDTLPAEFEHALLDKVFGVNRGELAQIATQLDELADQVEALAVKAGGELAKSTWTGAAASAFIAVAHRRVRQLTSLSRDLKSAATAVTELAAAF